MQDLLNRASPGKVSRTVTTSTDPAAGTTVTKTVITEHEERVERKEVISYSGNRRFMEEVEGARDMEERVAAAVSVSMSSASASAAVL